MDVKYNLEKDKESRIDIAKDLKYGKQVIQQLRKAKSEAELTRIMLSARKAS